MNKMIFAGAAALALSACANGSLMVEQPYRGDYRTSYATIVADDNNTAVDEDNTEYTERKLAEAFFEGDDAVFQPGDGITVVYRYLTFDEGSQALRYMMGPIAGGSTVVLEVDFMGPNGDMLSRVRAEGRVSGGFFGGSNKSGIDKAIDEIADYAAATFGRGE